MKKDDIYVAFTLYKNKRKELDNKYSDLRRDLEKKYNREIEALETDFELCIQQYINNKKDLLNYLDKLEKEKEVELGEKRKDLEQIKGLKKKFQLDGITISQIKKKSPSISMDVENPESDIIEPKFTEEPDKSDNHKNDKEKSENGKKNENFESLE